MSRERAALCACVCVLLGGCSMVQLAGGQLALINDQLPLPAAIEREPDPERRSLLREVPAILAYAEDVVGLAPGRSYQGYFATERSGLTYVLTACARTKFDAYTWWFPIVGTVEYRSYYDESDALAAARELEAQGYDTWISPSRAYSSLGILRDPVTTTMLRDGLPGLVEVIIHELSHAKLFIPGHTDWNEALASFVGERGAERYFESKRFEGTALGRDVQARARRRLEMDRAVGEVYDALDELYASPQPEAAKLVQRTAAFARLEEQLRALHPGEEGRDFRVNNARLLHFHRYAANGDVMAQLWAESRHSFRGFWRRAEQYARESL